jgi:hypothetical protein
VPNISPQLASIRSNLSVIKTDLAAVRTQFPAFSAIDMPVLGHHHTA